MIRVEVTGQDEVIRKLAAVSSRQARASILDEFGEYLVSETSDRFETETGPDGMPWLKSLRAKEDGGLTLTDTGILAGSISYNHTADMLEVGTATEYAAIHQFGGEIKPKTANKLVFKIGGRTIFADKVTMPARPFLGFTDQDAKELSHIVRMHYLRELLQ